MTKAIDAEDRPQAPRELPPLDGLERPDWSALPVPTDDGAASHLEGMRMPRVRLPSTDGQSVDLSELSGRTLLFIYPMTATPGLPLPAGWDLVPGARGCTPQARAFRDRSAALLDRGIVRIFGLSTQSSAEQADTAGRLHLPFALLSDEALELGPALGLPVFEAGGVTRLKRLTMIIDDARISKIFYPVFPPDRAADDVLEWFGAEGR